jgi:alpha-ketoglutarate-dependent 2,4-dichlorophenoxyacetate dioxygenase
MTIAIHPVHDLFVAEVTGVQCGNVDEPSFLEIRSAFEEYSVLIFRDQTITDEDQIAFSTRFGPLQKTAKANPGVGTYFARQSNLDVNTNEVMPSDDRRMLHQKANFLWHSDSSYRTVPALCSLLSARLLPPEGGNTEFATMRAPYTDLTREQKEALYGLEAEHSLAHSRSLVDSRALTQEMINELPPARQPLFRVNPVNGRRAVYAGSHASHIVGWPIDQGKKFIQDLNQLITRDKYVYSHPWRTGDMVLWDNRAVLHRATPYDAVKYKRVMLRTTSEDQEAQYLQERVHAKIAATSIF